MDKIPSPLFNKSPDSLSICGKLLKKGSPIIVDESLVDERVKGLAEKGIISISNLSNGQVQILRK